MKTNNTCFDLYGHQFKVSKDAAGSVMRCCYLSRDKLVMIKTVGVHECREPDEDLES